MKRLCVTILCLVSAAAWTRASAEELSTGPLKPARTHIARAKPSERPSAKTASLGDIHFSDPYAPPVGAHKTAAAPFMATETEAPAPAGSQGGFSLTAGREAPDAPFTGGLKLRF